MTDPKFYRDWGHPAHWDPPGEGPPGARDSATIIAEATLVSSGVTVNELTLAGQTVFGPGPLEVNSRLILADARLIDAYPIKATNFPGGPFLVRMWGETSLFGDNVVSMRLHNYGVARSLNTRIGAQYPTYGPPGDYGATWVNQPGSELRIEGDSRWGHNHLLNHFATFTNELGAAVVMSNAIPPATATIEWRLHNDGLIDVRQGTLSFKNPTRLNGPMRVSAEGVLQLEAVVVDRVEVGPAATSRAPARWCSMAMRVSRRSISTAHGLSRSRCP